MILRANSSFVMSAALTVRLALSEFQAAIQVLPRVLAELQEAVETIQATSDRLVEALDSAIPASTAREFVGSGSYFVVLRAKPGQQPGIYRTKRELATAVERVVGCYHSRPNEPIQLHPDAEVHPEGFASVRAADLEFHSKLGYAPEHHW